MGIALGSNFFYDAAMENKPPQKKFLFDFILSFLMPTLIGKSLVFYFGLNYSRYPGEGYGIGLALSLLFTLSMLGRFLWKYRNYEDI